MNINKTLAITGFLLLHINILFSQEPPNKAADFSISHKKSEFYLQYNNDTIFEGQIYIKSGGIEKSPEEVGLSLNNKFGKQPGIYFNINEKIQDKVEQRIWIKLIKSNEDQQLIIRGKVSASEQAFPAETRNADQDRFPMVRSSVGLSQNLRNNAIYDRKWDWIIVGPGERNTKITPKQLKNDLPTTFVLEINDNDFELIFRPRFYQKHKNLSFFEPWNYDVWKGSVAGWCSWWPYRSSFDQAQMEKVLNVFSNKNLLDYGYKYMQIDDSPHQKPGGTPQSWLEWNEEKWPGGMNGTADLIGSYGFDPGIWIHARFRDKNYVEQHPDYFLKNESGEPYFTPMSLHYAMDITNPKTIEELIRPSYKGFKKAGFNYVKVDGLRHLLYDGYNHNVEYLRSHEMTPSDATRRYLEIAREELGKETFMLACWGVLPEVVGLADGCRIGGDGFGVTTLNYFNSWNGVVWRNDPDHCDILPVNKPQHVGFVNKYSTTLYPDVKAGIRETIIRPAFASFASSILMLSDKAEVYENDDFLEGVKRSGPVLFTVPGQMYDVNPEKSSLIITEERTAITTGQGPRLVDAKRSSPENCPFWMMEINKPFEGWNVLARFNFNDFDLPETKVSFDEMGLSDREEYLVYEFWSNRFIGKFKDEFSLVKTLPQEVQMYGIRKKLTHPQIISTNRHISQGGVDLLDVSWNKNKNLLSGKSKIIKFDTYTITVYVPENFKVNSARMNGEKVEIIRDGQSVTISYISENTQEIEWELDFEKI